LRSPDSGSEAVASPLCSALFASSPTGRVESLFVGYFGAGALGLSSSGAR
jgi:hypothetical protein